LAPKNRFWWFSRKYRALAPYFLYDRKLNKKNMDLFIIILSFLLAYGIFILIAVKLAKIFFPKIDVDDMEMKSRRVRATHSKRITI
jgi:hypothetical protein